MIDTTIILCGGRGSRMGSHDFAKSLIAVQGRPMIWYIIRRLYLAGYKNFILPLGFCGQDIRNHVAGAYDDLDCNIQCIDTGEDTPIAGRLERVRHVLPKGGAFLLTNGDALFEFNLEEMASRHMESKASATFGVVETTSRFGLLVTDDGKVVDFERDSVVANYVVRRGAEIMEGRIYTGMAILDEAALGMIDLKSCENFETALYPKLISEAKTGIFALDGFWHAIDTPKDLQAAENIFSAPIRALAEKIG